MQSFDVLNEKFNIFGRHFVEASAGTGKTFAIENLYVRFLLEADASVEEILVVTFTRAATRELRRRIRKRMEEKNLSLSLFDRAQIFTIHGFAYRMLTEFHLLPSDLTLDEGMPTARLRKEVVRFLRTKLTPPDYDASQVALLLGKHRSIGGVIERILGLVLSEKDFPEPTEIAMQIAASIPIPNEIITPDRMLKKLKESLSDPTFVAKVRAKYRAVIVDEFQDTDPVQWEIFKTLFLDSAELFCVVGDPKQSIYSFRKADVQTYLQAGREIGADKKRILETNYRSTPELIEQLNQLLAFDWMPGLEVLPVKSGQTSIGGDSGIEFFVAETPIGRSKKWPSMNIENFYFFPFIAAQISPPYSRYAVLVKDRYQGARVQAALKKSGIPSLIRRNSPLAKTPAYPILRSFLYAVLHADEWSAIKQTLLQSGEPIETKEKFSYYKQLWQERGIGALWETIDQRPVGMGQLFELLCDEGGSPGSLFQFLLDLEGRPADEDGRFLFSPVAKDAVTILTIHMSKGLEFDTVFALGLASRTPVDEECNKAILDLEAEKLRQFYVACTRAKRKLYIPLAIDSSNQKVPLGAASPSELFCAKRFGPEGIQVPRLLPSFLIEAPLPVSPTIPKSKPIIPRYRPGPTIHSFSSLHASAETPSPSLTGDFPAGPEIGTLLHALLEKVILNRVDVVAELQNTPLAPYADHISKRITAALNLPLGSFTLADIPPEHCFTEMEFLFPTGENQLIKGFADLVFHRDKTYYILDWKSNLLPGYTQADLELAMQTHDYFLQASIYAEALQRYVKRFDAYKFGGAHYLFLRGPAVYTFFPRPL